MALNCPFLSILFNGVLAIDCTIPGSRGREFLFMYFHMATSTPITMPTVERPPCNMIDIKCVMLC